MTFTEFGATLIAKKILCTASKFGKQTKLNTTGRHNAQRINAYGSPDKPAYAIIDVPIVNHGRIRVESNKHYRPLDDIQGKEILGIFEKHPFLMNLSGKETRATFKGNPAEAFVNKIIEWKGN